jgi:hypothetical protein
MDILLHVFLIYEPKFSLWLMFFHHILYVMLCCFIDFFNLLIAIIVTITSFLDLTLPSPLNNDKITTW